MNICMHNICKINIYLCVCVCARLVEKSILYEVTLNFKFKGPQNYIHTCVYNKPAQRRKCADIQTIILFIVVWMCVIFLFDQKMTKRRTLSRSVTLMVGNGWLAGECGYIHVCMYYMSYMYVYMFEVCVLFDRFKSLDVT